MSDLAAELAALTDDEFKQRLAAVVDLARTERQENQLVHYRPVSETAARIWESDAQTLWCGGGNRSGKTDQFLALISACTTGVFPAELKHVARRRFRGPIRVRVICDSITTTLYPMILPKLQWTQWSGNNPQGGERGHWGWIPPYCLKDRSWDRSWHDKLRILTVVCRDPDNLERVLGESTWHFMSYDQEEGRGQDYHIIMHDEPPPLHIFRESQARLMGVGGRNFGAMTWPDDPAIPVDWIFDELYEPGMAGENKEIEWVNIYALDNPHVDRAAIAKTAESWSEETKRVRIYGQPIRFSNRVHPLFSDQTQQWCFSCVKTTFAEENRDATSSYDRLKCGYCGGTHVCDFKHVAEFDFSTKWPCMWLVDPHPRKPHRSIFVLVDPSDDYWQIDELDSDGDPTDVRRAYDEIVDRHDLAVALHLMDPNMGASPSSSKRGVTWQSDFGDAGLRCELADDSSTGRKHVNQYLKPDERRMQPRIHVHPRCTKTISDFKRHSWDDHKRSAEREQKQTVKDKHSDSCALWKYLLNNKPTFSSLHGMGRPFKRPGRR